MADSIVTEDKVITGLTDEEQKKLITVLKEVHPTYASYFKTWKMYLDAYKGGSYVKNYIYKHLREGDDSVKKRRERAVYPNYVRPIISLYLSYIYRRKIERSTKPLGENPKTAADITNADLQKEQEAFWGNCDGHGTNINKFMKKSGTLSKVCGYCGILVDMPKAKEEIKNEKQRKEQNHTPYLALYSPVDIVNWEVDEKGNLLWVRLLEEVSQKTGVFIKEQDRGRAIPESKLETQEKSIKKPDVLPTPARIDVFFSRKGSPIRRYITWTRDEWLIHQIRPAKASDSITAKEVVELVDKGDHNLKEVPFVFVYNEEDVTDPVLGISFLQDIAPLNILIMNWLSMLDEEIAQKTLNILTMQDTEDNAEVVIGGNNVLTYTGERAPEFIAPAATPGELIQASIINARDEIYRLAKLTGGVGVLKEVRSGISYCLSGDTNIECVRDISQYPNGIPIAELAEEFAKKAKPELYVYGYSDKENRIVLRRILDVWKSGNNESLLKIKYNWNAKSGIKEDSIKVTPEHQIMLRNGTFKRAKDLSIGDSLMPFGREIFKGYSNLKLVGIGTLAEHRFIMSELSELDLKSKNIVHHKNRFGLDNRICNLEVMSILDHNRLHMQTEETVNKIKSSMKRVWEDLTEEDRKIWNENRLVGIKKFGKSDKFSDWCIAIGDRQKKAWADYSDKEYKNRCILNGKAGKAQIDIKNKPWQNYINLKVFYENKKYSAGDLAAMWEVHHTTILGWLTKYGISIRNHKEAFIAAKEKGKNIAPGGYGKNNPNYKHGNYCTLDNHKITSIEECNPEDVYDMSVENIHNFVANNIVVHNSYEFQETEQTLADTADELEEAEIKIHRLWSKWLGSEWYGVIDYPDEFGIEDVLTDLTVLEKAISIVPSPTFKSEIQKKVVPKLLPKISEDTTEQINEEIDAFTDLEVEKLLSSIEQGEDTSNEDEEVAPPNEESVFSDKSTKDKKSKKNKAEKLLQQERNGGKTKGKEV